MKCRLCDSQKHKKVLDLGNLPVVNFVDSKVRKAPLTLMLCENCLVVQLKETVAQDKLFRDYFYRSSANETMRNHLFSVVQQASSLTKLKKGDFVLDIGSNDGCLLRCYPKNIQTVGFEPALALAQESRDKSSADLIVNDYFSFDKIKEYIGQLQGFKIITAIAMMYDVPDINRFVDDVKAVLNWDGVFVVQVNYLPTTLLNNSFTDICHEHIFYFNLWSLYWLFERHDLKVFDVETNDMNGGSIRLFVKHKECKKYRVQTKKIYDLVIKERRIFPKLGDFQEEIDRLKLETVELLHNLKRSGKKIFGLGASTRGLTLLNYYKLDSSIIEKISDRNREKWGKVMAGTNIPIVSEEQARSEQPDYWFVLVPWFLDELKKREKGNFIVPFPRPSIQSQDSEGLVVSQRSK